MRGTALAGALVLLLSGCGDQPEEPDLPEPGPLLVLDSYSCTKGGNPMLLGAATIQNTGEVPLTIDEVKLEGSRNVELVRATVKQGASAVDATIPEVGLDNDRALTLELRILDEGTRAHFEGLIIDYHNVDGRFRASGRGFLLDLKTACRL